VDPLAVRSDPIEVIEVMNNAPFTAATSLEDSSRREPKIFLKKVETNGIVDPT